MTAAKNALSGDESDSENENAVTDSEDEDQAYQNLVDKDENLINQVRFWPLKNSIFLTQNFKFYFSWSQPVVWKVDMIITKKINMKSL